MLIIGVVVFEYDVECGHVSRSARLRLEQDALLVRLESCACPLDLLAFYGRRNDERRYTNDLHIWYTLPPVANTHTLMLANHRIYTQPASKLVVVFSHLSPIPPVFTFLFMCVPPSFIHATDETYVTSSERNIALKVYM